MQKPFLRISFPRLVFALLCLCLAGGLAIYALTTSAGTSSGSGVAAIGGPFEMVNQHGQVVTEQSFRGKPMLVFFGYTYCPDVCPTELQVMAAALAQLGDRAKDIAPVLVTVDPARDTPEVLAAYVSNFGPQFVGLTGSETQVAAMAKAYKVYFKRQDSKDGSGDYLMDHSSIIYLMGPDGSFLKHFTYTTDAAALAKGIAMALGRAAGS